jgi:hypothetical protein
MVFKLKIVSLLLGYLPLTSSLPLETVLKASTKNGHGGLVVPWPQCLFDVLVLVVEAIYQAILYSRDSCT